MEKQSSPMLRALWAVIGTGVVSIGIVAGTAGCPAKAEAQKSDPGPCVHMPPINLGGGTTMGPFETEGCKRKKVKEPATEYYVMSPGEMFDTYILSR